MTSPMHTKPTGAVPKSESTLTRKQSQTSFRELLMSRIKLKRETENLSKDFDQESSSKNDASLPPENQKLDAQPASSSGTN